MPVSLPTETYSVGGFCQAAATLLAASDTADFVRFVLTGVYDGRQAVVDPILNRVRSTETSSLQLRRDYDSILGISKDICVRSTELTIYPLAKYQDSLKKNVHIEYEFENDLGRHKAPIHKIPNLCIGKWKLHNCIRILFVDLYSTDRPSLYLSKDEQADFYEKGLRPTVVELLVDRAADWPATYASELFRARGRNGQFAFGSKVLPDWTNLIFGDRLRSNLVANGVLWGKNLVFLHEIRGIKNTVYHPADNSNAEVALDDVLDQNFLRQQDLDPRTWYIDVALEISSKAQRCLAWRTDSHSTLFQEIAEVSPHHADRVTELKYGKYFRDPASHLVGVSGFRLSPGVHARGNFDTVYANVYHTDKGVTACPDQGHHGKFTTVPDIFRGKAIPFAENLYELYTSSTVSNYSCARAEIRVPLAHATAPMIIVNTSVLQSCLVSFSREEWWSLRAYRVLALKFVMEWQLAGPPAFRIQESALLLTAAVPWLLNGIHSTPDTKPASRELMNAILPHVRRQDVVPDQLAYRMSIRADEEGEDGDGDEWDPQRMNTSTESAHVNINENNANDGADQDSTDSEGNGNTVPHNPFGLVFIRPIRVGTEYPVPRLFEKGFRLSDPSFEVHFGSERRDINLEIYQSRVSAPRHPARIPNRARQRVITPPPSSSTSRNPFELPPDQGHTIHPPPRDGGSDLESNSDDSDVFSGNINDDLWRLWNQFCVDITAVSPNRKGIRNPPYCKLGPEERKLVNTATYQNHRLSDYFDDVQWKSAPTADWRKNFDRLFPQKGTPAKSGNVQHYGVAPYYSMWQNLMDRVTDETFKAIHKQLWKIFKSLFWMPAACSDRIWETRPTNTFSKSSSFAASIAAPKILLNGRHAKPEWSVQGNNDN